MVWSCKEDRKAKHEMRVEGRYGRGRPRIMWDDGIQRTRQKHGRTLAEMRRLCKDGTEWWKWIERGYPNA